MAGPLSDGANGSTFSSPKKLLNPSMMKWKESRLLPLILVAFLCSASYLLGIYHTSRGSITPTSLVSSSSSLSSSSKTPCDPQQQQQPQHHQTPLTSTHPTPRPTNTTLDFTPHHTADDGTVLATPTTPTFPSCPASYSEYTPCEDRDRSLKFPRDRLIYRERHCPGKDELLRCLIPAPTGYHNPFPWPMSRDMAWFANVPHRELAVEKAVQNWIRVQGDKFRFPGGGTMFPRGADAYIDDMAKLIPIEDGSIRTAVDTGCGVASFGAYLMSRKVLTMSFAPRDTHEAQVQFALERGVPALIGVLASIRLPYPSRAFDLAHCSRCLIPWQLYDGQYLAEVDRILRPGGYWVLSGPPINWEVRYKGWQRTKDDLNAEQMAIEATAEKLCWKKVRQRGDIAVWQKPINHEACKGDKAEGTTTPFCAEDVDPDQAWYTKLQTCITPLPSVSSGSETAGGALKPWPERLTSVPPRILRGTIPGVTPEGFTADTDLWAKRVAHYKAVVGHLGTTRYRNVLDMNARLGGFAAALARSGSPVWIMNVVSPTSVNLALDQPDTLGVVYERGLIGTYQDWCEAMSTYPRTYDLIHADGVFTLYSGRCDPEYILLEMDRVLRPEGAVIFRDDVDMLVKVKGIADGMRWDTSFVDHEDGPLKREKLLLAVKKYWTLPANDHDSKPSQQQKQQ